MSNKNDTVKEFEQYAEVKLKNHIAELNTRYENEKPDKEVLRQAYQAHREIFNKELDEKVQSLLSSESNGRLIGDLENIKDTYLSKLHLKNQ
jgi:predicted DsbA family dithiol-disulfide isomerase